MGGGDGRVHQKARVYNSGSVGQDALPGPLHLLVQIVAIPPKILKCPEKKKPNFHPPPPHTHTCVGAIHKGSIFEKCFLSEVITPITLRTKFAPLSPHKNISDPPYALPPPLCVLYHNIDSSDQLRVQGDSGGSL